MPSNVQPFDIARIYQTVEQSKRQVQNWKKADRQATGEFVGKETETVDDLMMDKEKIIAKLFGQTPGGMGPLGMLGIGAKFMNPLIGGIVSGLSALLGGKKQKKWWEGQIGEARDVSQLPKKYAKSFLGKKTKAFTHGYETKLDSMLSSLPSSSDIFKSSLMSGLGTYLAGGGKKAMTKLRAASPDGKVGLFSGGLDLTATDYINPETNKPFEGLGKNLFGEGSLLEKLLSGTELANDELLQLAPLLQLLKLKQEEIK